MKNESMFTKDTSFCCPKCESSMLMTERRPMGQTICMSCRFQDFSSEFIRYEPSNVRHWAIEVNHYHCDRRRIDTSTETAKCHNEGGILVDCTYDSCNKRKRKLIHG